MITLADINEANVTTLRKMAATAEITGRSKLNRDALVSALITHYGLCPVTGETECKSRNCELHYMDAPLNLAPMKTHNSAPHLPGYMLGCDLCESECFCDESVPEHSMPCVHCQENETVTEDEPIYLTFPMGKGRTVTIKGKGAPIVGIPVTDEIPEIVEAMEVAYQTIKDTCGGCPKCIGFMTNISRRKAYNKQTGRTVHSTKRMRTATTGDVSDFLDGEAFRGMIHGQFTPKQERRINKKSRKHALTDGLTNRYTGVMHWYNSEGRAVTCA